jgi:hypothetical protein
MGNDSNKKGGDGMARVWELLLIVVLIVLSCGVIGWLIKKENKNKKGESK